MTTGYSLIKSKKNQLIRKGLAGSVFVAPYASTAVTNATLFDPSTGDLVALPTGYVDLGYLTTAGAKISSAVTSTNIDSWGSNEPTRTDITGVVNTMVVEAQETKLATIGVYTGQATTGVVAGANGTFSIQPPSNPSTVYYRVLSVAVDTSSAGEFVVARFFPRASVTALNDQSMDNAADPITWGVTFTAFTDSVLGYSQDYLFGGGAALALGSDMTVPRVIVATTATDLTLVATTGTFLATDVGKHATGTGIFAGSTIATFVDSTHVTLSHVTTASATGISVTIS